MLADRSWAELFLLAGLAGFAEELLFRGVLQTGLARVIPNVWALLIASAAFGLAHFATSTYALLAGVMGLYLGTLLLFQGSLAAPIVTHTLYDLVALIWVAQRYRASGPITLPAERPE
jgi:membrane protease YdiL (CAAX protease family)